MDRRLADFERKRRVQQLLDECDLQGFKDFPIKRIPNVLRIRLSLATEVKHQFFILFLPEGLYKFFVPIKLDVDRSSNSLL